MIDKLHPFVLAKFAGMGDRLIALRSAGLNHVDLAAALQLGITVAHVPSYSPETVAYYTVALIS